MDTDQKTTSSPEAADTTHDLLAAIHEQGRQTLELVGTIVSLLMPKEGGREDRRWRNCWRSSCSSSSRSS